ncbi:MAG: hypothetical protein CM1200mP2_43500 [Planctomycetaceae bacterium]|nr:MAG: hypothetical protein CM1200mP2_43500 [Planctomycetaceae bacterium]
MLSIAAGTSKVLELEVAEESVQKKSGSLRRRLPLRRGQRFYQEPARQRPGRAMYWLARMLEAGEDPRFLARRLVILAAEDSATPTPRLWCWPTRAPQATERVGMPECRIILAQATSYLALAPKSNASYLAIDRAIEDVRTKAVLPVPGTSRIPTTPVPRSSGTDRIMPTPTTAKTAGSTRTTSASTGPTTNRPTVGTRP